MASRLALFDCDGTLVDSQHNICLCMEDVFTRAGLVAPDRNDIRRVVGLSLLPVMQRLAPGQHDDFHVQLAEDYKTTFQRMRREGMVDEPLFDGIAETLDVLEADGWLLGVATGKSDRGLDLVLRHHGIKPRFVTLQTADRHPSKPHPSMALEAMAEAGAEPATTVMIGDTSFDMVMGLAAGSRSLGVGWGYHEAAELIGAGAYRVVAHPSEIGEALI